MTGCKVKKYGKFVFLLLSMLLTVIVSWFTVSRMMATSHAVRTYEISPQITRFPPPQKNMLNVGSFNIAHGRGGIKGATNWQTRTKAELLDHLKAIAKQIEDANLDIVVLNEVDFSAAWSFHANQAAEIASQAGYRYIAEQRNIDASFPFYNVQFGNAILSHYPIIASEFLAFPPYSRTENLFAGNHNGLFTVIHTPSGQIGVLAIHLEYRSEDIRVLCAHQVKEFCTQYNFPLIAAGDFNSTPVDFPGSHKDKFGENAMTSLLSTGGFKTYTGIVPHPQYFSFPSEHPAVVIDWVLAKGEILFLDAKVIHSTLSDHVMIMATLQFEQR